MTSHIHVTSFLELENGAIEVPEEFAMGCGITVASKVGVMGSKEPKCTLFTLLKSDVISPHDVIF